jgi:hypothetical protein
MLHVIEALVFFYVYHSLPYPKVLFFQQVLIRSVLFSIILPYY